MEYVHWTALSSSMLKGRKYIAVPSPPRDRSCVPSSRPFSPSEQAETKYQVSPLDPYSYLNEVNNWASALPFGYAFIAGMVASINPCGFLMLPSYAAFYLAGGEGDRESAPQGSDRAIRALFPGAMVTLGFIAVFGSAGVVVSVGGRWLLRLFPWGTLLIGGGLVLAGLWLLLPGRALGIAAATRVRVVRGRSPTSLFAFGIAYGIASLGCTLPIFLAVVGTSLGGDDLFMGAVKFLNYALGMGLVLTVVTLAMAYSGSALNGLLRKAMPVVERLGSVFLLFAGAYLIYYWYEYGRLLT